MIESLPADEEVVRTRFDNRSFVNRGVGLWIPLACVGGCEGPPSSGIGEGMPEFPPPLTPGKTSIPLPTTPSAHNAANSRKTNASFRRYPIRPNRLATSEVIRSRIGRESVAR